MVKRRRKEDGRADGKTSVKVRQCASLRVRGAGRVAGGNKKTRGKRPVYEMYVFLAIGEAKAKNEVGCREGEPHSLLVFSRQGAGTRPDEAAARRGASFAGWKHVKLERSRRLEAIPQEATLRAAYEDALELGCAVVADRRALAPARRPGKADRRGKERKA
jgi:hypothetical protein